MFVGFIGLQEKKAVRVWELLFLMLQNMKYYFPSNLFLGLLFF